MRERVFITGGTGFLGLALGRVFLGKKWEVVLYDQYPLRENDLRGSVEVIQGDVRDFSRLQTSIQQGDVVIHAAAALPIRGSKRLIFDVNVNGTKNVLTAAKQKRAEKVIFISSTAVYGVPKKHPILEEDPMDPIGHYGVSKIEAEKVCCQFRESGYPVTILRPKTFLGPGRLGIFQILFEWIYQGNAIYIIGNGENRYQLLALSDLINAVCRIIEIPGFSETLNIGASEFGTVRQDLSGLISHAQSGSALVPLPAKPIQRFLRLLELARLSPLAEWHYRTASEDSFVSVERATQLLDWAPQKSNVDALIESYENYCHNRLRYLNRVGETHATAWNPKLLRSFQIPAKWLVRTRN